MFVELSPETTGIVTSNAYDDPRIWAERYREFGVGAIGTGVAIGDYDNDGQPDVLISSKVESCRLFRNLGNWRFEDVTVGAGLEDTSGEWKQGVTFADVNNDGWLDIYVCRFRAPNQLFINQGDGTFRDEAAARGLALVDASVMAAFADYDRDGWLDVYVQTNLLDAAARPDGQPDYLFRNRGDGTFEDVTERAGIRGETQGHAAVWWDHDEDGWPDLYVANDFGTPDFLYRNERDGRFTQVAGLVLPRTPLTSMGVDLGDINNDGRIDFLVADMAATTHEKDQRTMADSRGLNRDFSSTDPGEAPQVPHSTLYVNTGTGRFLEAGFLAGVAATDWTWSVRFEDLDNDGRLDLHVTNGMNREQHNVDLLHAMMMAGSPRERVRLMKASPVLEESNLAYRNLGDMEFEPVGAAWGLDQKGVSFGAAFGDLDGDGDLDLVYANFERGATVLRNDSDEGHRVRVALRGTASNRFGVGATVRLHTRAGVQVRQLVVARGYVSSSELVLHFGLGEVDRIDRLTVSWPGGRVQEFTDLAVDATYTITEPEASTPPVSPPAEPVHPQFRDVTAALGLGVTAREEPLEGTVNQPLLPMRYNRRGPGLAIADLDGDGVDEIVFGATSLDPVRIFRRAGGRYEPRANAALATPPPVNGGPLLVVEVDGRLGNDLLLTAGGAALPAGRPEYEPRLLFNDGDGGLRPADPTAMPSLPTSAGTVIAADFDRDGALDVFVGGRISPGFYPDAPISALLRNRGGRFEDVTDAVAPGLRAVGMVTSALWSDVDGDGWPDLLVALDWGGVRVFRNDQGKRFEDRSEAFGFTDAGTGWWTSLATADFNGDGKPDFVAGNLGLNTAFRATPERPVLLYVGDFAGNGTTQIVDAYHDGDRLVPRRSRRELGARIPAILKRFPKNDLYARATLEEILGPESLAAATRLAATELRSGVFLSRPDGRYAFVPLPRIVQIAPVQGLVAGDFDGDGHADIYAVHNFHGPAPTYGRLDGGLGQLLRGAGDGTFAAVPASESGLVVPGDAKALAVADLDRDGWPDFVVTRNNASALAFRNETIPGRRMLQVRLRGPVGNPSAIGARIEAEFVDGLVSSGEVSAGGGFNAQSTAGWFVAHHEGRSIRQIRVRWPDGASTTHNGPFEGAAVVLHPTP